MRKRYLTVNLLAAAALVVATADASGQTTNPRFGVWKMQSDAPPPSVNIMTYESYGDGGMRITVESTNSQGRESKWGYVTMFDGVFRPVTGREGAETAVEIVNDRTTRISNKRNGRVTQVIINTLSEDGNSINNEYVRLDENGDIVRVTHAVYERIG
ncbi:MAG: hypothetical protein O7F70_09360 [Gemmatimonadetes bacterium]|nr:hypothetical protein [Gemmatimonadota bacterium]